MRRWTCGFNNNLPQHYGVHYMKFTVSVYCLLIDLPENSGAIAASG